MNHFPAMAANHDVRARVEDREGDMGMNFLLALAMVLWALTSHALATEIKVISVGTVSPVLHELIPQYERQSGDKVLVNFGNPAVTLERLTKGEPADIVMVAGAFWEQAEKGGRLKAETKTVLPATSYSIGMKPGTKPTATSTFDDVKRLLEQVQSIALVDRSPSIPILMQSAGKMGIAPLVEAKSKIYSTGGAIAEALARSEVELGITTLSELVAVHEVVVLGPVPSEILPIKATTTAAITKDAAVPEQAAAFLQFLTAAGALAVFKAKGFDVN
jgi:molybdate transport system substrate-binding protein